ncbi:meiosis-specific coiled-coil domain-containing protein MEIOC [Tautogolabrus adspersus]
MHRQTVAMNFDDSMGEQYKITPSDMSSQTTSGVQIQKQLGRKFGTEQIERNGGANNQTFNYQAYLDLPGFSPQNTDYFEQPKPSFASLNRQNRYQNKMTMHRQNASIPNIGMKQFTKQHNLQAKIQGKIKPPMQEENKRMLMSSFLGEGLPARPQSNTDMRGDEKQGISKNMYFDPMGNMQFKRFDDENNIFSAGNTQQLLPFACPVNDPRRMPSVTINSSNFSSRHTQPYGRAAPCMDVGDMVSSNESAAFNSYVSDAMSHRGESTYHGMTSPMVMNQGGPVFQLNFYLDECYEQWKCLEKEREQTQAILSMTFHGKKTATVINTNIPKTPQNPTRVDHLIVKNLREQARVASLLDRMECLHNIPLHTNIRTALNRHNMAISFTQARRKEEIDNMSKHQRQRAHFTEDRDTLLLVFALKDLAATTRKLRTALWCAHQMTLPKPVGRQEKHAPQEAPHSRRSPSPLEGYSF